MNNSSLSLIDDWEKYYFTFHNTEPLIIIVIVSSSEHMQYTQNLSTIYIELKDYSSRSIIKENLLQLVQESIRFKAIADTHLPLSHT